VHARVGQHTVLVTINRRWRDEPRIVEFPMTVAEAQALVVELERKLRGVTAPRS
jgi:hypothetical protein